MRSMRRWSRPCSPPGSEREQRWQLVQLRGAAVTIRSGNLSTDEGLRRLIQGPADPGG